jgi:hypothetical protein
VRSQKAPWLTDEIKRNINRRDFLKKKAIQSNSSAYHNAYKSLRNKINKQIIDAKRLYYTDCIDRNKNNTKQMWKNINHLINKKSKSTNISSLQIDDQVVIECSSMSNLFNEYFTDIGPTLSSQIPDWETNVSFEMYKKFSAQKEFNFSDIHILEVLNEISKLNTSKSVGPDNIPAKLVKDSKDVVAPFLTLLFNASLKDNGNTFFYSRYLLNIPTEYLITYFHLSIAFSCSEIS